MVLAWYYHGMSHQQSGVSSLQTALKLTSLAEVDVVVVVAEAEGGRKWAGSGALKDAFLRGALTPAESGAQVEIDPRLSCLVETKTTDGKDAW